MRGQPGHNTRPHARLTPGFLGLNKTTGPSLHNWTYPWFPSVGHWCAWLIFWHLIHWWLHNPALADARSTDAGTKCLCCNTIRGINVKKCNVFRSLLCWFYSVIIRRMTGKCKKNVAHCYAHFTSIIIHKINGKHVIYFAFEYSDFTSVTILYGKWLAKCNKCRSLLCWYHFSYYTRNDWENETNVYHC